jgi:hypothetical protein
VDEASFISAPDRLLVDIATLLARLDDLTELRAVAESRSIHYSDSPEGHYSVKVEKLARLEAIQWTGRIRLALDAI